MKIRSLTPKDIPAVNRIHFIAFAGIHETEKSASIYMHDEKYGNCVAEIDEKLVGYSFFCRQGKSLYWNWLAVLPEFEGAGVAEAMLNEVESWANREGLGTIILDSRNRFKKALVFYLKNGFDVIGTFLHSDGEVMIRLSKKNKLKPT